MKNQKSKFEIHYHDCVPHLGVETLGYHGKLASNPLPRDLAKEIVKNCKGNLDQTVFCLFSLMVSIFYHHISIVLREG